MSILVKEVWPLSVSSEGGIASVNPSEEGIASCPSQ